MEFVISVQMYFSTMFSGATIESGPSARKFADQSVNADGKVANKGAVTIFLHFFYFNWHCAAHVFPTLFGSRTIPNNFRSHHINPFAIAAAPF